MPEPADRTSCHISSHTVQPVKLTYGLTLQKEPKLSRARQIPEWEEYDAEIAHFASELAKQGKIRSGIVAADANVLADVGASSHASAHASSEEETEHESQDDKEEGVVEHPRDEL